MLPLAPSLFGGLGSVGGITIQQLLQFAGEPKQLASIIQWVVLILTSQISQINLGDDESPVCPEMKLVWELIDKLIKLLLGVPIASLGIDFPADQQK